MATSATPIPSYSATTTQLNPFYLPIWTPPFLPLRLPLIFFALQLVLLTTRLGHKWSLVPYYLFLLALDVSYYHIIQHGPSLGADTEAKAGAEIQGPTVGAETRGNGASGQAESEQQGGTVGKREEGTVEDIRKMRLGWWVLWVLNVGVLGPQMWVAWRPLVRVVWAKYVVGDLPALFDRMAREQAGH